MSRGRVKRTGFSLMELLAVVAILGALAAILIPRMVTSREEARRQACFAQKGDIELQVQLFYRNQGSWPAGDLSNMQPPGTYAYFPEGTPTCPVDGSVYTIDPSTHHVQGHTHE